MYLKEQLPQLTGKISFDPKAGMFCAYSDESDAPREFILWLKFACENDGLVEDLFSRAALDSIRQPQPHAAKGQRRSALALFCSSKPPALPVAGSRRRSHDTNSKTFCKQKNDWNELLEQLLHCFKK